jgi:hypothetical protein
MSGRAQAGHRPVTAAAVLRNRYSLTPDGLNSLSSAQKVHDRILRPLMANDQPQTPPPLR